MKNKYSIIIPTYRRAKFLERAIKSVLNQTYKNYEVIVVDDNNPNTEYRKSTEELMSKYIKMNNVKYIKHNKNSNGASARNTGIKVATGDYVTFLDDDDIFLPNRLLIIDKEFSKQKDVQCIYTGMISITNKKIINILIPSPKNTKDMVFDLLSQKSFFGTGSNFVCTLSGVKEIDGFDTNFNRHQDIEFMIRFIEKYKIISIPDISVIKTGDSVMNVPNIKDYLEVKKLFFNKFSYLINKYNPYEQNKIFYYNYNQLLQHALYPFNIKYYKLIRSFMKKHKKGIHFKQVVNNEIKNIKYFILRNLEFLMYLSIEKNNYKNRKKLNKDILTDISYIIK